MPDPEELLSCALTFRDAAPRMDVLPCRFSDAPTAVRAWLDVLLHEAREEMQAPLADRPERPYLHPVDVDTDEPGIVSSKDELRVLRRRHDHLPRISYACGAKPPQDEDVESESIFTVDADRDAVQEAARAAYDKALKRAQRAASTAERREEKQKEKREEKKEERARETPEERRARLDEAKRKREERKKQTGEGGEKGEKGEKGEGGEGSVPKVKKTKPIDEVSLLVPDLSASSLFAPPPKRQRGKESFFAHPLPHHRHLQGLQRSDPHTSLLPALLRGESCDDLEVIQGPPGTGKTRALVARLSHLPSATRVLLCAPTNVGAANLYERCVQAGWGDECALALAPERVPPGTAVLSNDPSRRLVCATISARSGRALNACRFQAVLVDEAAQCMEAWVWTLLRPEVTFLALAGDVRQLPALASESGRLLRHERSLMERLLLDLQYDNVVSLTVQHRMAPALLAFPNEAFYEGRLTTGSHAPTEGRVEVHMLPYGREDKVHSSTRNRAEAEYIKERLCDKDGLPEDAVLLAPYAAQCRLLLAQGTGRAVHTLDSFQGREADVVVLSVVRDGTQGLGFWEDERRLVVALTRARRRLLIVASGVDEHWPKESLLYRAVRQS